MTAPPTTSRDTAETAELLDAALHYRQILSVTFDDNTGRITITHCPPGLARAAREVTVFASGWERVLADVVELPRRVGPYLDFGGVA